MPRPFGGLAGDVSVILLPSVSPSTISIKLPCSFMEGVMRTGCRILDGELAVSTGPGPLEIGVGEALPGGRKLLGRSEGLQGRSFYPSFL